MTDTNEIAGRLPVNKEWRESLIGAIRETADEAGDPCDTRLAAGLIDTLDEIVRNCRATGEAYSLDYQRVWRYQILIASVFPTGENVATTAAAEALHGYFFGNGPLALSFGRVEDDGSRTCSIRQPTDIV